MLECSAGDKKHHELMSSAAADMDVAPALFELGLALCWLDVDKVSVLQTAAFSCLGRSLGWH